LMGSCKKRIFANGDHGEIRSLLEDRRGEK